MSLVTGRPFPYNRWSVLNAWDTWAFNAIHIHLHHPLAMAWMFVLTRWGDAPIVLTLAAVCGILAWRHRRREVIFGVTGILLALQAAGWLKGLIHRPRPAEVLETLVVLPGALGHSFPSGHTTGAFALAAFLAACWPRWQGGWWTLAVLVGWSRVYLGLHYPSDCLAGALLGAGVVVGATWLGRRWPRAICFANRNLRGWPSGRR